MVDASDDATVIEFLSILEEHRLECVQNGLYAEAEVAQKRLDGLRAQERERKAEGIRARHIAERLDVEEAHMLEFESFNGRWDKKMQEYDERTGMLEQAMVQKHREDLEQWQEEMHNQFLLRPKYSKDLLNLRKIQETLANQRDYAGAQKMKLKADNMQKWELEGLKKDWRRKVASKQGAFISKQTAEQATFRQRIEQGREKQKRIRQEKLNRLLQRYQNIKAGLARQQSLEASKEQRSAEVALQTRRGMHTGGADPPSSFQHPRTNLAIPIKSHARPRSSDKKRATTARTHIYATEKTKMMDTHGHSLRKGHTAANAYSGGYNLGDARSRLRRKPGSQTSRGTH